jgi:hypothetical protein
LPTSVNHQAGYRHGSCVYVRPDGVFHSWYPGLVSVTSQPLDCFT